MKTLSKGRHSERSEESTVALGIDVYEQMQILRFAQDDSDSHRDGWAAGPWALGMAS